MKNIMKRENGQVPATFGNVVDQLFQKNLSRFFDDSFWSVGDTGLRNAVPVNIRETATSYEMEMMVAGLKKEDLRINASGDTLTVSYENETTDMGNENGGQPTENKELNNGNPNWIRQEYRLRSFSRSFTLDDSIDAGRITARYENGVLFLSLPKKEHARAISRSIEVN